MTIFLILAPYGAFAILMLVTSATVSLFAAAAICLAVIAYDIARGRSIKILGVGSVIMFAAVGGYVTLIDPLLSTTPVKFAVDVGIFLVSLLSIVIRRPFTLQYALEAVDAETARLPGFLRANYIITWAWTAATLLMMIANVALLYVPGLPLWSGLADCLRRPQQRGLFHQMVSGVPQGEVRQAVRPTRCPATETSATSQSTREHDDEGRIRQTCHRLSLHHRVPRDLSRDRQRAAGDRRRDRRRGRAGDLLPHQGHSRSAS